MIKCGWCGTNYVNWKSHCDSCGGPLPAPPGLNLGEPPPPAPRALPRGFAFRQRWSRNIATIVGVVFALGGVVFCFLIFTAKPVLVFLPLLFAVGGISMFRLGWKNAQCVLNAFRNGTAVEARVAEVRLDTTQSINKVHPWILKYHFPVGGHVHEGSLVSWDTTVGQRVKGQPLWVLYIPDDPDQNTIYPPIK
jgi:hypothetical protein